MKRKQFKETDYIGKEFNYLTIIKFTKIERRNGWVAERHCLCRCKCGNIKEYFFSNIKSGLSKSCGCKPPVNHNPFRKKRIYRVYLGMLQRCYNRNLSQWGDYGGRGITVCKRWRESFYNFLEDMGEPPSDKHSIDRKDNEGDYTFKNCRWATQKQQMNNTRLTNELTAGNLAKATGYSSERIRQLTKQTSSDPNRKTFPLQNYICLKIKGRNIYKKEAIQFLLERKLHKNSMEQSETGGLIKIPEILHKELKQIAKREGKFLGRVSQELIEAGIKAKRIRSNRKSNK